MPVTFSVRSANGYTVARTAYILAYLTKGVIATDITKPYKASDVLLTKLGADFDIDIAFSRLHKSPFNKINCNKPSTIL